MPLYITEIPADGPDGSIFVIIGRAAGMLRELGHSRAEIERFRARAHDAGSYAEACAVVEEYFPLRRRGRC